MSNSDLMRNPNENAISVKQSVHVPLPPEEAFDLFTNEIDLWWPKHRRRTRKSHLRFDPETRKHLCEDYPDGTSTEWARVNAWVRGERLGLTWIEDDPESEVEILFLDASDGTRVEVTHRVPSADTVHRLLSVAHRVALTSDTLCRSFATAHPNARSGAPAENPMIDRCRNKQLYEAA